jgi:Lrp/AsnC family transcriptional regulator, leucine-responsive regulatory protein
MMATLELSRGDRLSATNTHSIGIQMQLSRPLDGIDRKIVALLQQSAKRTFADIGANVGLSATAVKRRVDRLEGDGVIIGYGARINWRALGEGIESLIEIYCADRTSPADVGRSLTKVDEIVSAFTVSGEPDAVIRVRVDNIEHLERLVERLRRDPNIVRTRTLIVLSTLLDRP